MNGPSKVLAACVLVGLLSGGVGAVAATAIAGGGAVREGSPMQGCLDVSEGTLTLADAGSACDSDLVPVAWQSDKPATGAAGTDGADGADGAAGKTGVDGAAGAAGNDGAAGQAGVAGRDGAAGRAGSAGATGAAGADGKDGHAGTSGRDGANGAAGKDGAAGSDGKDGAAGRDGANGAAGKDGVDGKNGAAGEAGAEGRQGDKGDKGEQGERGEQGQTGATGAAGKDGAPAWEFVSDWSASATYTAGPPTSIVTFGGATYVAARSSVGAPPADSPSDWILIAAAGLKGERGEKGETGAAGEAGKDGADGSDGVDGAAGAQGSQGAQGIQGLRGLTGAAPWAFTGAYDSEAEYSGVAPASVVEFEGSTYVATREEAFSGVVPTDTTAWALLAAKGAAGAAGAQGIPGPQGMPGATGNSALQDLFGKNTQRAAPGRAGDCVVGELALTAGTVADGIPAMGQILPVQGYQALYSLYGTTYGGNGITTFGLPDMRGLAPNNMTYSICVNGIYPIRD